MKRTYCDICGKQIFFFDTHYELKLVTGELESPVDICKSCIGAIVTLSRERGNREDEED